MTEMHLRDGTMDLSNKVIIKVRLGDDIRKIPVNNDVRGKSFSVRIYCFRS